MPSEPVPTDLSALGAAIAERLRAHFPAGNERDRQVMALAEEVGEFVGAYRRWSGNARRTGPFDDVRDELADVVITAYVTAAVLDVDLDGAVEAKAAKIFTRGWRDEPAG
ncbi:MazG nucleotide pyrophosphohydrolase domain-containing protein [Actinomadura kijaniata]|uniref:MazG nucleotide pyrophosphohydrolase domain-containing protein n=1 Tax=Actinomadura kijaniata TaxID=46161 RepID=UPI003F1B3AE3